jgi:hypothetical protein
MLMSNILASKWIKWGAALCLAFCLALLLTSPVHAEGETPPEPVPVEEVAASEAPPAPEESPATEEVLPEETLPPEVAVTVPAEPVVEETTQEVSDVLALAEESGVALVESSGDPYFKVGTVKYCFMSSGTCDSSCAYCNGTPGTSGPPTLTPINDAVIAVAGGLLPTDRKIYVEGGTYNESVTIDGVTYPFLGKLTGLIGAGAKDGSGNPLTTINGWVYVNQSTAGFTLSGFTVNYYVGIDNAIGTVKLVDLDVQNSSGSGIMVDTTGSVELNGVESSNNTGYGATVTSTGSPAYTVKLTNCEFDDNNAGTNAYGLAVSASGPVTLDGVSANRNRGNGADFTDFKSLTVKNSLFNANYEDPGFTYSWGYGLLVDNTAASPVTLANVVADGNENNNIHIETLGSVTASDVMSRDSKSLDGMFIDNSSGASSATVSITRGVFSDNYNNGLVVQSKGNITLTNITANDNTDGNGAYLNNCVDTGSGCTGTGSVTLGGVWTGISINEFARNAAIGLEIYSKGNITLSNLDAHSNGSYGIYIENNVGSALGNVTLNVSAANWANGIYDNGNDGLYASSNGNISVDKSIFNDNDGYGAYLINVGLPSKTATFKNSSASRNDFDGLYIEASGNVTLSSNAGFWENTQWSGNGATISTVLGNVNVSGSSSTPTEFSRNLAGNGLRINANGTITLNYITAEGNGSFGAKLNNSTLAGKMVSVSNSSFDGNGGGLEVNSLYTITLNTVSGSGNVGIGAMLDNCMDSGGLCTGTGNVTITALIYKTNTFSDNGSEGLTVYSQGSISLTNVVADNNYPYGAHLRNAHTGSVGNVTMTATSDQFNSFSNHADNGLLVESYGNISLARLVAEWNGGCGAKVINDAALSLKTVSVSNGWFNHNRDDGLRVRAKGNILLSGVQAVDNSVMYYTLSTYPVTAYEFVNEAYEHDYWYFDGNGSTVVITIRSLYFTPNITVNDGLGGWWPDYNDNHRDYATVSIPTAGSRTYSIDVWGEDKPDDDWGGGSYLLEVDDPGHTYSEYPDVDGLDLVSDNGGVTITNSTLVSYGADVGDNSEDGIQIEAVGAVNLAKVTAWHNGWNGVRIGDAVRPVTTVALSGVYADENFNTGVYISSTGTTTLTTGSMSNNHVWGLCIDSKGTINLSGLDVSGNTFYGAQINNVGATLALAVSIANSNFNNNEGWGLVINSKGNITLNNVNASGNSLHGGWLDISAHGQTVYEHLGESNETDNWWFNYNTSMGLVTIEVDSDGTFTPYLAIYYLSGGYRYPAGSDYPTSGSHASYTFNPGWNNDFYVEVGGGTGHYDISFNDPNLPPHGYPTYENPFAGVMLDNCIDLGSGCIGTGNVTFTSTKQNTFNGNNGFGVFIKSKGTVSVTNANASTNGDYGIAISNTLGIAAVTVKSSSSTVRSQFDHNTYSGLDIDSSGTITLANLIASSNGQYGANLDNIKSATAKTISVTNSRFNDNGNDGLYAHANGAISFMDVWAMGNTAHGLHLKNHDAATVLPITVKRTYLIDNDGSGLVVYSQGLITVDNITAQDNDLNGAYLSNDFSAATGGVNINSSLGANRFIGNGVEGLIVYSTKAITGSKITSLWNGQSGVALYNHNGSGNITLTTANIQYNNMFGLSVFTKGWVNLNYISSMNNGTGSDGDGALLYLYTAYTSTIGNPVRILNSVFQGNEGYGIQIQLKTPPTSPPYKTPYIYNTAYMGNDVDGDNGGANLLVNWYP